MLLNIILNLFSCQKILVHFRVCDRGNKPFLLNINPEATMCKTLVLTLFHKSQDWVLMS